jgi:hypothetical protein
MKIGLLIGGHKFENTISNHFISHSIATAITSLPPLPAADPMV